MNQCARVTRRIVVDAAEFGCSRATAVEVGRLKAHRVETNADANRGLRAISSAFASRRDPRPLAAVGLVQRLQHIDRAPGPVGLSAQAAPAPCRAVSRRAAATAARCLVGPICPALKSLSSAVRTVVNGSSAASGDFVERERRGRTVDNSSQSMLESRVSALNAATFDRKARSLATGFRPAASRPRLEAAVGILGVVGLVEIVREEVEQAVPRRLVALLDRIDDHHEAAGLQHARHLRRAPARARLAAARASGTTRRRDRGSHRRTAASRPRPRSASRARCGRSGGAPRRDRAG